MSNLDTSHLSHKVLERFLLDRRRPVVPFDPLSGTITLDFGIAYRAVCLVFFALASTFVVFGYNAFRDDPAGQLIYTSIFGSLWVAAAYAMWDCFGTRIRASEHGIDVRSWFLGRRLLPWLQIEDVRYATMGRWYSFRSTDGWSVRISVYRDGLRTFASLVEAHIERTPARRTPLNFYSDMTGNA